MYSPDPKDVTWPAGVKWLEDKQVLQSENFEEGVQGWRLGMVSGSTVQEFRDRALGKPYMREMDREILKLDQPGGPVVIGDLGKHTASIKIPLSLQEREIDDCK